MLLLYAGVALRVLETAFYILGIIAFLMIINRNRR